MELLAPAGNFECLKAAVQNGADSIYFGASSFSARASAANFSLDNIEDAINYAKLRGVKVFLTLNTLIKNQEFSNAIEIAKVVYNAGIDAIIVQDIGLACFLIKNFPDLDIHASTQMSIHNLEGVLELEKIGFKRVILSRELMINEIDYISRNSNLELETFVHGALCISYSGQCLFSSIVGGRSGNRGTCAGPCRLPYELLRKEEDTYTKIDSGYLLNTKDLSGLHYIPELTQIGVKSLKIEGRLKSPEYVATVTRIYRKYIDMALNKKTEYIVDENDVKELLLSFNRGGFSSGHLDNHPNMDLIHKEKTGHSGIYIGNVAGYNPDKGYLKLILNESLSIGDTVCVQREDTKYTVSELMKGNKNFPTANQGETIHIGRVKGNIKLGDRIYKMTSKTLLTSAKDSYSKENKKIKLHAKIVLQENKPIFLKISTKGEISTIVKSDIYPIKAKNKPITKERIVEQLNKTISTPFEFENICVDLGDNLFIPNIKVLNELRRSALGNIEQEIIKTFKRNNKIKYSNVFVKNNVSKKTKVSLFLRILHSEYDYTQLDRVDNIYLPLWYFPEPKYEKVLKDISSKFNIYVHVPTILKGNYKNIFKTYIDDTIKKYNIKGFVLSNIGDIKLLENYIGKYEFIGDSSLNVFNSNSIIHLKKLGIQKLTLSLELNKKELSELCDSIDIPKELIIYGRQPLMTCSYCFLGNANKCFPDCTSPCNNGTYYLRDRLGFLFKTIVDYRQTTTTIFNSKITSIDYNDFNIDSVRIDIIDKNVDEINFIVETIRLGKRFEGQDFTNGNLNKTI